MITAACLPGLSRYWVAMPPKPENFCFMMPLTMIVDGSPPDVQAFWITSLSSASVAVLSVPSVAAAISPVPLFIKQAAMKFAAELCYARRGAADQFPWKEAVTVLRGNGMVTGTMTKIATGEIPLFPKSGGDAAGKGRSKAYVEPSKIHSTRSNA